MTWMFVYTKIRKLLYFISAWLFLHLHTAIDVLLEKYTGYISRWYLYQGYSAVGRGEPLNRTSMELKGRVLVYSILGCPHCMRAKSSLQQLGIPYIDVSLDKYPHARQELQSYTSKRTVPQIFFNAKHIGGNEELQELVITYARSGKCKKNTI